MVDIIMRKVQTAVKYCIVFGKINSKSTQWGSPGSKRPLLDIRLNQSGRVPIDLLAKSGGLYMMEEVFLSKVTKWQPMRQRGSGPKKNSQKRLGEQHRTTWYHLTQALTGLDSYKEYTKLIGTYNSCVLCEEGDTVDE